MAKTRNSDGFTLIEVVIVIGILAVLGSLLLPALGTARDSGRNARCLANVRQIGLGLKSFQIEYRRYPSGSLRSALRRYMPSEGDKVYLCPFDEEPELGDSYSDFYCPRWSRENGTGRYVVSCPRHGFGARRTTVVLFTLGEAGVKLQEPTEWNGYPILPGTAAVGGVLRFADGSTSVLAGTHRVEFLTSFDIGAGHSYSVLKVEDGVLGELDSTVTPGSKFEVVTPAAVAGVEGTSFEVLTYKQAAEQIQHARVTVSEGSVTVTGFDGTIETVQAGNQVAMKGASIGAVSDAPGQGASEGPIYIRGVYYYRDVQIDGTMSAEIRYREWDHVEGVYGDEIGKEVFRRDVATGDPGAGWYKIEDTFTPND
jgi:prepilin-type N-terminal cleavage/methylation domain-containing protein